jgi:hypothetical protein
MAIWELERIANDSIRTMIKSVHCHGAQGALESHQGLPLFESDSLAGAEQMWQHNGFIIYNGFIISPLNGSMLHALLPCSQFVCSTVLYSP